MGLVPFPSMALPFAAMLTQGRSTDPFDRGATDPSFVNKFSEMMTTCRLVSFSVRVCLESPPLFICSSRRQAHRLQTDFAAADLRMSCGCRYILVLWLMRSSSRSRMRCRLEHALRNRLPHMSGASSHSWPTRSAMGSVLFSSSGGVATKSRSDAHRLPQNVSPYNYGPSSTLVRRGREAGKGHFRVDPE